MKRSDVGRKDRGAKEEEGESGQTEFLSNTDRLLFEKYLLEKDSSIRIHTHTHTPEKKSFPIQVQLSG